MKEKWKKQLHRLVTSFVLLSLMFNIHIAGGTQISPGNYVTFGHYPQSQLGNDKTPLEWLVLEVVNGYALLLSRYGLDEQPYNTKWDETVTWETCSLRKWLNGTFLNTAFSIKEQESIIATTIDNSAAQNFYSKHENDTWDKVFLLSSMETFSFVNYDISTCVCTPYAIMRGVKASTKDNTCDWWWLRSPGLLPSSASSVGRYGARKDYNVDNTIGAVRPAIWVDLGSGDF